MNRSFFLLLAALLCGTILAGSYDQQYQQHVGLNGASKIVKKTTAQSLGAILTPQEIINAAQICGTSRNDCFINESQNTMITTIELTSENNYYTFETDYGFPFIEHHLVMRKLPTDKFGTVMATLINAVKPDLQLEPSERVDLDANNTENGKLLKQIGVNISYEIIMPGSAYVATGGAELTNEGTAKFELSKVLEQGGSMEVRSREPNWSYIAAIAGIAVLSAFAASFYLEREKKTKKKQEDKKNPASEQIQKKNEQTKSQNKNQKPQNKLAQGKNS
ncbi:hypothetical protein HY990_07240 [Candidatus Micrarchaeota archaeon]|nr:hypothetical protein [Candidatus Micrarchaeota archaeon]